MDVSANSCIRCLHGLVSNPSSPRRITYEVFGLLLIIYDLIWLPMQVFDPADSDFSIVMGVLSSIYWTFDIPLSFLVGFAVQDKGIIEMRLRKIAWNYLKSWLPLDVAIVAIDWVINFLDWTSSESVGAGEGISFFRIGKAVRFLRLLRLLRLLKAHGRFNELLEHVQSEFSVIVIGVLRLIAFIMLLNHIVACVWFWIGQLERPDTWLLQAQTDIMSANLAYQYFTALHWSFTQFTPASMEVTPKNEIERLFNVVVIISAMVIFSTFISAITNAMNQLRNLNSERNEQASLLRRYMQQNSVSAPLKARVLQSVKALSQTRSRVHEADVSVLRLLPLSLRHDLSQEVYAPHLGVHPFFYVCNVCFSMQSRKIYSTALTEKSLSTSQELITSGENATHMYFVIGGVLDYKADDSEEKDLPIALETGAWLCEAALWVKWQHNGTAQTGAGCELISVDAGGLQSILKDEKPVRQYASMFCKYFSDNPDTLSDVWADEEALFDWATRALGQAETYYGDVIPAETTTAAASKFSAFVNAQRRASSGFIGRRFSDDSLSGLIPGPSEMPQLLEGMHEEGVGRLASQEEGDEADSSSSSSGLTDSE
ncbi:Kcnh1 [Symbiodinium pilosum]|uniref:Kcnh1 protein n=1 Tax=Symbiodinium pilosum TaxID=2952 RepID=A0A812UUK0_SYMPI|nr:Kcnh1 [Symbiodinium pilosum]